MRTIPDTHLPQPEPSSFLHHGYRHPVVADWRELVEGDDVVLIPTETSDDSISGTVDAVTEDGTIIWLLRKGGGRRMFHHIDGYKTLVETARSDRQDQAGAGSLSEAKAGLRVFAGRLLR